MSDKKSLVIKFADRYSVDATKVIETLKQTAFQQKNTEISNAQMMALLIVADQYKLNPFTREIYAFPDKNNGIVPVVGIDGWSRIINENPNFDGIEFVASDNFVEMPGAKAKCPEWIKCIISRKDRSKPTEVTEYIDEVYRKVGNYDGPWQTHPKRMLRHKAAIQCARLAFGFVGIYDPDEAERIIERDITSEATEVERNPTENLKDKLASRLTDQELVDSEYVSEDFEPTPFDEPEINNA